MLRPINHQVENIHSTNNLKKHILLSLTSHRTHEPCVPTIQTTHIFNNALNNVGTQRAASYQPSGWKHPLNQQLKKHYLLSLTSHRTHEPCVPTTQTTHILNNALTNVGTQRAASYQPSGWKHPLNQQLKKTYSFVSNETQDARAARPYNTNNTYSQ